MTFARVSEEFNTTYGAWKQRRLGCNWNQWQFQTSGEEYKHEDNLLIVYQPHHCDAIFSLLPRYYDSRHRCISVLRSVWKAHTVSDIKSARWWSGLGKPEAINHSYSSVQNPGDPCQIGFVWDHQAVTWGGEHLLCASCPQKDSDPPCSSYGVGTYLSLWLK